mmetsp:Transcript_123859/g.243002  ORF Transcript_123859/g.243002 Transcript_123859/m.243002 type:complete len:692 (-) Transcript_123859:390-2465(-)
MNELHFSANGLGVVLKTKHGGLRFTTEEFSYYKNLFIITDSHNMGKLAINSMELNCLLIRTDIAWTVIEKVLGVALKHRAEGEDNMIYFYQWLIICKLVAYYQETKRTVNDKLFKIIHTAKASIPFANFNLCQTRKSFLAGTYYEEHRVNVRQWMVVGEGFQDQHVKFSIDTASTVYNHSDLPTSTTTTDSSAGADETTEENSEEDGESSKKSSVSQVEFSIERRYSEFNTFATILQKNFSSVVVPPLPVKNWNILSPSETNASQRAIEFQMFLNDLVSHPVLRYSFELKAFLQSSSQGFKSFVDLYSHIQDGKVYPSPPSAGTQINDMLSKLLTDSASVVTTGAATLFNNMWDSVKRNVPVLSTPPATRPPSNEHDKVFNRTLFFLEGVLNVGRKLEEIVGHEQAYQSELAKIAQCCKNMAEFETNPELTRVLNLSNSYLSGISRTQLQLVETQHLRAEIPLVYMGRYKESYQLVMQQRAKLEEELQSASRAELTAQQNVEKAHSALVASGGSVSVSVNHGKSTHRNSNSSSNSSSNGGSAKLVEPSPCSPSGSADKKSGSKDTTTTAATGAGAAADVASPAAKGVGSPIASSPTISSLSPAETKSQIAEKGLNQAKLDLAAAEDNFEQKRASTEEMNASLRAESIRLEALERAQLMRCATAFVRARMEAARSSRKAWEELKLELENTGS